MRVSEKTSEVSAVVQISGVQANFKLVMSRTAWLKTSEV